MIEILKLCEQSKYETNGYFDANINNQIDPAGIVKGYAIQKGAEILKAKGFKNIYVEIAGDIQVFGGDGTNNFWRIGIQNPFEKNEIVKVVRLTDMAIATSGNYRNGLHITDPIKSQKADSIESITVIGPNILDADRFATAAFAMGEKGLVFLDGLKGFAGYLIKKDKTALYTRSFNKYIN
jgi:thiamine biosynthesis lipoprotein